MSVEQFGGQKTVGEVLTEGLEFLRRIVEENVIDPGDKHVMRKAIASAEDETLAREFYEYLRDAPRQGQQLLAARLVIGKIPEFTNDPSVINRLADDLAIPLNQLPMGQQLYW
jgi:hypothetical protein